MDIGHGAPAACTDAVQRAKRKNKLGSSSQGVMMAKVIAESLFQWFVDTAENVKGYLRPFLILQSAAAIANGLTTCQAVPKLDEQ